MPEPISIRIEKVEIPVAEIFKKIASKAWDVVKDLGHEFAEHAPEIATTIANSYMDARAARGGGNIGVDLSKYDIPTSLNTALHMTNPYQPKQTKLPERRQANIARTAL